MCVILVCPPKVRPTLSTLKACAEKNPHGAGIAWRNEGSVSWVKTDDLTEIYRLAHHLAGEIVIHFRIATVGNVCPELRHPFPIERKARLCDAGQAKAVLFQNGTWREWRDALVLAEKKGHSPPSGPMSDTRAASWLCAIYGRQYLNKLASSRWVYFSEQKTFLYGHWCKVGGIHFSNLHWLHFASRQDSGKARLREGELPLIVPPGKIKA